jgi:hypothetical protein
MPYDLFISYSRRDNEQRRITQFVERIKTDFASFAKRELVPFFDQQEKVDARPRSTTKLYSRTCEVRPYSIRSE